MPTTTAPRPSGQLPAPTAAPTIAPAASQPTLAPWSRLRTALVVLLYLAGLALFVWLLGWLTGGPVRLYN
jgi:hypothetical protein